MEHFLHNETDVLRAACKGDRTAYGQLVRAYQRRAYAVAYSLVRNSDDAIDIAQESFVRAFRAMKRFDPEMPFYPWLYRIVKNTALNAIKKKKRRGETSLNGLMEEGYDPRSAGQTPRCSAEFEDLKRSLNEAIARLTPEQQEILQLRHFLELSYAEIAARLDIPAGTVMSRLHTARKNLKLQMTEKEPDLANI